jgi:hypothetical protein
LRSAAGCDGRRVASALGAGRSRSHQIRHWQSPQAFKPPILWENFQATLPAIRTMSGNLYTEPCRRHVPFLACMATRIRGRLPSILPHCLAGCHGSSKQNHYILSYTTILTLLLRTSSSLYRGHVQIVIVKSAQYTLNSKQCGDHRQASQLDETLVFLRSFPFPREVSLARKDLCIGTSIFPRERVLERLMLKGPGVAISLSCWRHRR